MKYKPILPIFVLLLSALACGLPSPAPAEPTVNALPPTPDLPVSSDATLPASPHATEAPPETPFTGTWVGPDPDDGSIMTIILTQSGDTLTGAFEDTFSTSIPPPGYQGNGTGTLLSPASAQMTFQLSRHDGKTLELQVSLTLTDQNTLTLASSQFDPPWVLKRQ